MTDGDVRPPYRPEIDGLRAIAVLPVVWFHAGFAGMPGGYVGVDVFFVISGYLITGLLAADLAGGRSSILRFYERRARRILPALFTVLLACLPLGWFFLLPEQFRDFGKSVVAVVLFVSNIHFALAEGYFAEAAELKPLLHTWSLAVEEQFYLIYPLLLGLLWPLGRRRVMLILAAVAVVSLAGAEWNWRADPDAHFYFSPTRAWELMIGALVALAPVPARIGTWHQGGAVLGLAMIGLSVVAYDATVPFPGLYTLVPVVGAALILHGAHGNSPVARLLATRALRGIGLISFSLYLWHQPLFAFARVQSADDPGPWVMLALVALAFALSVLTWRYIEQPFRRGAGRTRGGRLQFAVGCGAMAILLMGSGAAILRHDGFPGRVAVRFKGDVGQRAFVHTIATTAFPCAAFATAPHTLEWSETVRCAQSVPGHVPGLALIGDSFAEHLYPGLATALAPMGVSYYTRRGLPLVSDPEFRPFMEEVARQDAIGTVAITANWSARTASAQAVTAWRTDLAATVALFRAAGKRVLLIDEVPPFRASAADCKYRIAWSNDRACYRARAEIEDLEASYAPALAQIAQDTGAILVTLKDPFCDAVTCAMVRGNAILYRDKNHLNIAGSQLAAEAILGQVRFAGPQTP